MKKWEYHYIESYSEMERADFLAAINELGAEGWRLLPIDLPKFSGVLMERKIPEPRKNAIFDAGFSGQKAPEPPPAKQLAQKPLPTRQEVYNNLLLGGIPEQLAKQMFDTLAILGVIFPDTPKEKPEMYDLVSMVEHHGIEHSDSPAEHLEIERRKQNALEILHNEELEQDERVCLALDIASGQVTMPGDELWESYPEDIKQLRLDLLRRAGLLPSPAREAINEVMRINREVGERFGRQPSVPTTSVGHTIIEDVARDLPESPLADEPLADAIEDLAATPDRDPEDDPMGLFGTS